MTDRISTDELRKLLAEATPGPWAYNDATFTSVWGPSDEHIHYTKNGPSAASNARLIAAAPDLAAEVIRLREALEPFAAAMQWIDAERYDDDDHPSWAEFFKIGDFRRADAALNHKETDNGTS